jgi:hypothetical protein
MYSINKKGQESLLGLLCFEATQKLRYNRINRKNKANSPEKSQGKQEQKCTNDIPIPSISQRWEDLGKRCVGKLVTR